MAGCLCHSLRLVPLWFPAQSVKGPIWKDVADASFGKASFGKSWRRWANASRFSAWDFRSLGTLTCFESCIWRAQACRQVPSRSTRGPRAKPQLSAPFFFPPVFFFAERGQAYVCKQTPLAPQSLVANFLGDCPLGSDIPSIREEMISVGKPRNTRNPNRFCPKEGSIRILSS